VGPIESETYQPEKAISNKIKMNHAYLINMNYWAPLQELEEDEDIEGSNLIRTLQSIANTTSNKWKRRIDR
jgi:hypothetical protein